MLGERRPVTRRGLLCLTLLTVSVRMLMIGLPTGRRACRGSVAWILVVHIWNVKSMWKAIEEEKKVVLHFYTPQHIDGILHP